MDVAVGEDEDEQARAVGERHELEHGRSVPVEIAPA